MERAAPRLEEHVRHDQRSGVIEVTFQALQQLLEHAVLDQFLVKQAIIRPRCAHESATLARGPAATFG
jgi:hypothetical protein